MKREKEILRLLQREYQHMASALHFGSIYQLLVAVILSAQTNDNQVNKITEKLFEQYGTPETMATLSVDELEQFIKTCGLYKNKAKNVLAATKMILEEYGGDVPQTREELMLLPGVGRKTANVVLSVGYKIPALAVDTHVFRVAHRLGFSAGKTPDRVEADLCAIIPEKDWADAHHWFIWHGRKICSAQKPKCAECFLRKLCTFQA